MAAGCEGGVSPFPLSLLNPAVLRLDRRLVEWSAMPLPNHWNIIVNRRSMLIGVSFLGYISFQGGLPDLDFSNFESVAQHPGGWALDHTGVGAAHPAPLYKRL
ncbi:hypothetical protein MSG28_013675 [Choristoneura fumiferana]|uniref:Uncharacterized protein n=1 Tax=Choristoneura fumiferana TaxID=7141 RepID=A0ACC0K8B4_CHOFU|nr:hypothetical protein MSG28_013675 [Choristoneura fumiferana]